jgi:molecular chaperone DnaK
MDYRLGVDLGTTYTAAAILQGDEPQIVPLGDHEAFVPSVIVLQRDADLLVGEPAERRSVMSPGSTAREFKRRLGDSTPVILDGVPYSAHALMATVLRWVLDQVSARQGGPPISVAVTYPANWGEYRREVLVEAIRQVGVEDAVFLTEPEAAAVRYASLEQLQPGEVIGVYDLGGGTFDAAILRRGPEAFELLGRPAGVEQLGGVDIDEAVFAHVRRTVGEAAFDIDPDDTAVVAALHQLRRDCVLAKEALSYDTETSIPVNLPGTHTVVRLTRGELEDMIRPLLAETISAFRRALGSSGCSAEQLSGVLLAGGSSRIPLVAELLSADLGRSVAVNAHPKHIVALGAAIRAAGRSVPAEQVIEVAVVGAEPAVRDDARLVVRADPIAATATGQAGDPRASPRRRLPTVTLRVTPAPQAPPGIREGNRPDVTAPVAAAVALAVLTLVLAFFGFGAGADGDVSVTNAPPGVGVRLEDPLVLTADGRPLAGQRFTPSLAGVGLATKTIGTNGTLSLWGLRQVMAGPFEAVVRPGDPAATTAGSDLLSQRSVVVRPEGGLGAGGLLSLPGVVGLALVLFALAYAESFLRPLRRGRRTSGGMLLGMGMVGAAAGVGLALIGWTLGNHLLSMPLILLCALTGLAGCLCLTVALSRRQGA